MDILILICVVIVALIITSVIARVTRKRNLIASLKYFFGKKKQVSDYDIARVKKLQEECFPEDVLVDEITQNDLELDKVFREINHTDSFLGEQFLWLNLVSLGTKKRFSAVQNEFMERCCDDPDMRLNLQVQLSRLGKYENNYRFSFFMNNIESLFIDKAWVYAVLAVLLVALICSAIFTGSSIFIVLMVVSFLTNIAVYAVKKSRYEQNLLMLEIVEDVLEVDTKISGVKKDFGMESEGEADIRQKLKKSLGRKLPLIRTKQAATMTGDVGAVVAAYVLGAFLIDFLIYNSIIKSIIKHKKTILRMALDLGEIDTMVSTASYACSLDIWCIPEQTREKKLCCEQIYHPLLEGAVCNDLELKGNCIITGSNASGKSTFIKALAVNVILARSIGICSAESFVLPEMEVYTSMALRDNLTGGESFFVKEVKSIKRIIDHVEEGSLTLIAIDEILKGTNSEERVAASAAVLRYLTTKNCLVIVASHDYELLEMVDKEFYHSYYFCEKPGENEALVFDYKIHDGFKKQTNAIHLLEYMGFPDEIVSESKALLPK